MRKRRNSLSSLHRITLAAVSAACCLLPVSCKCARENVMIQETADSVPEVRIRRATLVFGGDVMMHIPQLNAGRTSDGFDFSGSFRQLKPFFDSVDMVMLNLETTISQNGRYSGYPLFASPPELLQALKGVGVDVVALANNHICDKHGVGLRNTVEAVEQAGMKYVGAYADSTTFQKHNPLIISLNDIRIALMNYTYGTNGMPVPEGTVVNLIDTLAIRRDLRRARESGVDCSVVYVHWGYEYAQKPSLEQAELAAWCKANGADLVIGTHPHVLQPIETMRDATGRTRAVTAYSLGNLISNQRWRYADGGMLLKIDITLRDNFPAEYETSYLLTWVLKNEGGQSDVYEILPSVVADTMRMPSADRRAYQRFISDSRKMLGDLEGVSEITTYQTRDYTESAEIGKF